LEVVMNNVFAGTSEYDRFGPWIDEVNQLEDVPRLYRNHPIDFSVERLVLKVPRNITYRNAPPDMDLYDHLIMLGQDQLTVLSRHKGAPSREGKSAASSDSGKGYDVVAIPFADVVAIRNALNLLDGRLTVSTAEGTPVRVSYNGSAGDVVVAFVRTLSKAVMIKPASHVGAALLAAGSPLARPKVSGLGLEDRFLETAFLEAHNANPNLSAWAAHGTRRLAPQAAGLEGTLERIKHGVSPMTLYGALFTADENAMEAYGRHSWLVRGRGPCYSTSHLVIPFSAPDRLDLAPHPLYPDATVATIGAGKWRHELPVPRDSVAEHLLRDAASRLR
jgi:hypothetical protein